MSQDQTYSFFRSVERSFDKAAIFTDWDPGILEQIKYVTVFIKCGSL